MCAHTILTVGCVTAPPPGFFLGGGGGGGRWRGSRLCRWLARALPTTLALEELEDDEQFDIAIAARLRTELVPLMEGLSAPVLASFVEILQEGSVLYPGPSRVATLAAQVAAPLLTLDQQARAHYGARCNTKKKTLQTRRQALTTWSFAKSSRPRACPTCSSSRPCAR